MTDEATDGAAGAAETGDTPANPEDAKAAAGAETGEKDAATDKAATTGAEDWREAIADAKIRQMTERFTSPADLAKSYAELNSEFSRRIKVPGQDASDEDVAKFRKAVGVPEDVAGYEVKRPEHMTEEAFAAEGVQGQVKGFLEAMHAAGANKGTVEAALGWYWAAQQDAQKAILDHDKRVNEETEAALRKEWSGDYDRNMALGKEFVSRYGSENLLGLELKDGSLLGSNPVFAKMAAEAGRRISEGQLQAGLRGTEAGTDLQSEYDRLSRDYYKAFDHGDIAEAKRIDAERSRLSEQLHGSGRP